MYKSFYNLSAKPFQISTNPKFFWLGEKHREALATLKYGVLDNKGFLLITGDVGTGKTTLINALTNSFGPKVIYATIPDPGLENLDFFRYIAHVFKFEKKFENKGDFLILFGRFLLNAYRNKKTVVLIIDEAQLLSQEMLEQIRLLSNIEKQQRKLINIFFVGQSEFNDILLEYKNRALRQRITINYNLSPLILSETGDYIKYRLKMAGSEKTIFNPGAIKKIYAFSKGYPRLINIICDHAMLTGYVKEARTIDADIIRECVKELNISPGTGKIKKLPAKSNPSRTRVYTVRENHPGRGRRLTYILLALFLVFGAALSFNMGGATEGLIAFLKRIEGPGSALDRPSGTTVSMNGGKVRQGAINKQAEVFKTTAANIDPVKAENELPVPVPSQSQPGELPMPAKTGLPETTRRGGIDSDGSGSPAPVTFHDKPLEKKDGVKASVVARPAAPPAKPSVDPIVAAREFIARTGGRLTIHFGYNSNEIATPEFDRLDEFASIAAQIPEVMIIVTGHTDTSGSDEYNRKLSKFRANIVKSYFVGKGVVPENIISIGRGPEAPMVKSAPGVRSMSNRRVEIEMKIVRQPG